MPEWHDSVEHDAGSLRRHDMRIFISYSPSDRRAVEEVYNILAAQGFRPWMDTHDLAPGSSWQEGIVGALRDSECILICLSKASLSKDGYLQREIKYAQDLAHERSTLLLIPVRLEECEVPRSLARFQWINWYERQGRASLLNTLHAAVSERGRVSHSILGDYQVDNIIALLLELPIDELRRIFYELPRVRHWYREAATLGTKFELITTLLRKTTDQEDVESLLGFVERRWPTNYGRHKPYHLRQSTSMRSSHMSPRGISGRLENPYVVGNPIQPENARVFLGRFDIATSILSEINHGSQKPSILLYGRRRMGKTSALLNMGRLMRDMGLIHVYISGQSARFHNNVSFCCSLAKSVIEKLQEDMIDTTRLSAAGFDSPARFADHPVGALSEFFGLCDRLLEEKDIHCLLAIDEYEEIDTHIAPISDSTTQTTAITRELLLEFRDTMQHRPRFVFLFSGTHFLRDLSRVDWTSIFINVKTLHISFLTPEDGMALLTRPVPELDYESDSLLGEVLTLTGCQPFLLQAVASEIVNVLNAIGRRTVTPTVLNRATNTVLTKHNTYFDHIWDVECPSKVHKKVLTMAAINNAAVSVGSIAKYADELRDLVRREVLRVEGTVVHITMPLVRNWLKKNQHIL